MTLKGGHKMASKIKPYPLRMDAKTKYYMENIAKINKRSLNNEILIALSNHLEHEEVIKKIKPYERRESSE